MEAAMIMALLGASLGAHGITLAVMFGMWSHLTSKIDDQRRYFDDRLRTLKFSGE